jgi:hypothetical protein
MLRVVAGPRHVAGITCWCRPRPTHDETYGQVWLHRNVVRRPDVQPRCFQSIFLDPPV